MKFTIEQLQKAKKAKSIDELIQIAKEDNIELSKEQAQIYFNNLNKEEELSDSELCLITGGSKGEETKELPPHLFNKGDSAWYDDYGWVVITDLEFDKNMNQWYYTFTQNSYNLHGTNHCHENKLFDHVPKEYM